MKFKVGDKVRGISTDIQGCEGIVVETPRGLDIRLTKLGNQNWHNNTGDWQLGKYIGRGMIWGNSIIKIGGSKMSKYQELKNRIESLDNGWDKEADDILSEVDFFKNGVNEIKVQSSQIAIWFSGNNDWKYFSFNSQCERMSAFKKALLWLLDHSNIKKDLVGQEVKADIEGKTYKVKILGEI